jgi:hypothetical protein
MNAALARGNMAFPENLTLCSRAHQKGVWRAVNTDVHQCSQCVKHLGITLDCLVVEKPIEVSRRLDRTEALCVLTRYIQCLRVAELIASDAILRASRVNAT